MINIKDQILRYSQQVSSYNAHLIAISKTKPDEALLSAYEAGQRDFGENKVQELCGKYERLPKDIKWHMVGHLQRNKIKYIAPFVYLIHSVDSFRLLEAIDKEANKCDRIIHVLLQVHIAQEESKFGFDEQDINQLIHSNQLNNLKHVMIRGLMGMATNTDNENQIRMEFRTLKQLFDQFKSTHEIFSSMDTLSMGMSGDYLIALEEGSTMVRIGSSIFGDRNYA